MSLLLLLTRITVSVTTSDPGTEWTARNREVAEVLEPYVVSLCRVCLLPSKVFVQVKKVTDKVIEEVIHEWFGETMDV